MRAIEQLAGLIQGGGLRLVPAVFQQLDLGQIGHESSPCAAVVEPRASRPPPTTVNRFQSCSFILQCNMPDYDRI
jgi:hypothetical protein